MRIILTVTTRDERGEKRQLERYEYDEHAFTCVGDDRPGGSLLTIICVPD